MGYEIQFQNVASSPLAVVRRRASKQELSRVVPECCGLVWNALRASKVSGAGRHIAIYLDSEINLEIGVELAAPIQHVEGIIASVTPAGPVASTVHFGPYPGLHQAHRAIQQWCLSNGHEPAGPSWEIYGHWIDAWNNDPSQIRTDVYYLLKAGKSGGGAT